MQKKNKIAKNKVKSAKKSVKSDILYEPASEERQRRINTKKQVQLCPQVELRDLQNESITVNLDNHQ